MSYQSQAALSFDAAFRDRSLACCKEQALIFKDDQRPEFNVLAWEIIADPSVAHGVFELVCVQPGFTDVEVSSGIPDVEILSAVQVVWPTYGHTRLPDEA